jgi:single-stranded DNA-specific DHH superfamily exonuclease
MKAFLDLVTVGTMADVVRLTGINRVFIKAGLEVIGTMTVLD